VTDSVHIRRTHIGLSHTRRSVMSRSFRYHGTAGKEGIRFAH
jgi:hypothetical protein